MLTILTLVLATSAISTSAAAAGAPAAKLPPAGCHARTFRVATPAEWYVTDIPDPPEGREGCSFLRMLDDGSLGGHIRVESFTEQLPMFRQGNPVETLVAKTVEGLAKNLEVAVKPPPTYRNDTLEVAPGSRIDRAHMLVFDASVPDKARRPEVVMVVAHSPGYYFTVVALSPGAKEEPKLSDSNKAAFREVMNSLVPLERGRGSK